jgi:multiple sugar transport system ATP-binding protein
MGETVAEVKVEKISKAFGNVEVIKDLDLEVEDGSFVVLLGPSGCGKSTLLRMIAGLETISDGDVFIGNKNVNNVHPKDRNIAMVFQNYALYAHMSVFENMAFSLRLRKMPQTEINEKVNHAASILNLTEYLDRFPRQLSGGQRQRVAMGRAIVRDPAVFLFDEPLSNLDAKLRVQMRTEIRDLHLRLRTTTVYVTHDQIEAMTMADRIVIMQHGVIEQQGSPLEVYDRPANLFVAEFIGSPAMNFFDGKISKSGSKITANLSNGEKLSLSSKLDVKNGAKVVLGVRPEHFEIGKSGLPFEIKQTEPTGPEIYVFGKVVDNDVCVVTKARVDLKRGDTVYVSPKEKHVHIFDKATGKRL